VLIKIAKILRRNIEMYDPEHHIWSKGLVGLVIKEECKNANLRDWEIVNVRSYVIQVLLGNWKI